MRRIKFIVVHHNGVAGRTIEHIRRAHKARGWSDVGYHYVIHEDGVIHRGRPESKVGAHVKGLNASSLGVCLIGNGNKADFSLQQYASLRVKLRELCAAYPEASVIGHREANAYLPKRLHTRKQCPGKLLSMSVVRLMAEKGMQDD